MKINKKMLISSLLILALLTLVGCGSADGPLYKKSHVLKKVSQNIPSEKYKFDRIEPVPDASVSTEIYYFKSKDRDLEFRAINTRQSVFFESGLYGKCLHIKYAEDVHKLYEPDIDRILTNAGYDLEHNRFLIDSFNDLTYVSDALSRVDDVYKPEINYNSAEWMEKHPATNCKVSRKYISENGKETGLQIGGINIDGTWDQKKIYDYLCYRYAMCIKRGEFEDILVPPYVMDMAHAEKLEHVYINDIEVSETGYQNTKAAGCYNNSENSYYAYYCYKMNDYVIPFSTAIVPEDCGPHVTEEYLDVLAAPGYEVEYKKGIIKWEYNDSSYEAHTTEGDDGYVNSFIITKDGKDINIPYIKCGEWTSPVYGVYMVDISVHDFAKLFDLSLEIDEENGCVYFYE